MNESGVGPVFIVGVNGSGTTMLADSLGHHSGLYVLPIESKILPHLMAIQGRYGDLAQLDARRRLARDIGRAKPYWQSNGRRDVVLDDRELQQPGLAGVVDAVYLHFAAQAGKRRWGDKSPINTQHVSDLAGLFPEARFVHIVRDGRDAAQSFHRRWGYHPLNTILKWKRVVAIGERQGMELGASRYLRVSYEVLTERPREEMARVCEFLGLPFEERVLHSSMRYVDRPDIGAQQGRIITNSDKWQSYFAPEVVRAMETIAGKTLTAFGYRVSIAGDENPGRLGAALWSVRDRIVYSTRHFSRYGWHGLPMYLRQADVAIRQWLSSRG